MIEMNNAELIERSRQNLNAFIDRARRSLPALGSEEDFDEVEWDITHALTSRSSKPKPVRLHFTLLEDNSLRPDQRRPMNEPFMDFVKAAVRTVHDEKAVGKSFLMGIVRASRYLHASLENDAYDPTKLTATHFAFVTNIWRSELTEDDRYALAGRLRDIIAMLNARKLTPYRIDFNNPFERREHQLGHESQSSVANLEHRRTLRITEDVLFGLAQISNQVTEPSDIVMSRAIELLAIGGWRISEILTTPYDCEVEEEATRDGKPELDQHGLPITRYGIRYWPAKAKKPAIKWIPTPMVDVARRAVADVLRITKSSRELASWLEANKCRARLPENIIRHDQEYLTGSELSKLLGQQEGSSVGWARRRGLLPVETIGTTFVYNRYDVEAVFRLESAGIDNPKSLLRLSQHLFLVPYRFFAKFGRNDLAVMVVDEQHVRHAITVVNGLKYGNRTIFERFGVTREDGTPISIQSHDFRRWLNTIVQQGGMHQHEIARWFGKDNTSSNDIYNYTTPFQKAEQARNVLENGEMLGGLADLHRTLPPVERASFRSAVLVTAHVTDIGLCGNDWSLAPCPYHGGCGDCEELLVVKGDIDHRVRAEVLLEENAWLLETAREEAGEDTYGASNHVLQLENMVRGLKRILAVHADPSIPDGTLVHVNAGRAVSRTFEHTQLIRYAVSEGDEIDET